MSRPSIASAVILLLASCTGPGERVEGAASPTATERLTQSRQVVLRGTASYRERIKTPPGARLEVSLVDPASNTVVAEATMPDVAGPPIAFELPVDRAGLERGTLHVLRARLVGPDGMQWFVQRADVLVDVDAQAPLVIDLVRSSDSA